MSEYIIQPTTWPSNSHFPLSGPIDTVMLFILNILIFFPFFHGTKPEPQKGDVVRFNMIMQSED